jgi:hypothetical protein
MMINAHGHIVLSGGCHLISKDGAKLNIFILRHETLIVSLKDQFAHFGAINTGQEQECSGKRERAIKEGAAAA